MDARAHAAANRAVGNPAGAAALECTLAGPTLAFLAPRALRGGRGRPRARCSSAPTSARGPSRAERASSPAPATCCVRGPAVRLPRLRRFAGGIDVAVVLGSRSTELSRASAASRAGRSPPATRSRSCPAAGDESGGAAEPTTSGARASAAVRVVLGPQEDHFDAETIDALPLEPLAVSATSDRVGCRLEGEPLRHAGPAEILSDGMVPGSIQVPPDGQPIVMLADGPTTGGYPKIATVVSADLPLLAQLVPEKASCASRPCGSRSCSPRGAAQARPRRRAERD